MKVVLEVEEELKEKLEVEEMEVDKIYNIFTLSTLSTLSTQSTPNIHQHAHQREYILIDTKIVKIGYPQAELGQEGHLTLLDLM